MGWKKISKREGPEGRTIVYENEEHPLIKIESRLRHIPHKKCGGTYDHTSYFVLLSGTEKVEKMSLRSAQEYAEKLLPSKGAGA